MNRDRDSIFEGVPDPEGAFGPETGRGDVARELPHDVRGVGRLLDARGAKLRAELGSDALERIVAASDLQLPVDASGPIRVVRPQAGVPARGLGRSASGARGTRWGAFRIAASVAVLVGVGASAYLLVRNAGTSEVAPRDVVAEAAPAPDAALAAGGSRDDASGDREVLNREARNIKPRDIDVWHFERALSGDYDFTARGGADARASSDRVRLARGEAAGVSSGAASEPDRDRDHDPDLEQVAIAGLVISSDGESLLDGVSATYDDLSGEFAALCGRSTQFR